jgi:regulator of protease activity HflC (stomatin/prohibitin superfamily)
MAGRSFATADAGIPSTGAKGFIDNAVDAVADADSALSELQDSSLPTEVGDVELRAALTEVRELLGGMRQRARELERTLGR